MPAACCCKLCYGLQCFPSRISPRHCSAITASCALLCLADDACQDRSETASIINESELTLVALFPKIFVQWKMDAPQNVAFSVLVNIHASENMMVDRCTKVC